MIKTTVVIANWNGKKYLKDCFDSLRKQSNRDFEIILVDNGSEDESAGFVKENYPETEIIQLEKNRGFAYPYNLGIQKALEDKEINYIVVLNNDTKLHENYLQEVVKCAEEHPASTGSIQPKILNFFDQEKIDCAGIVIAQDGTAHNRGYGQDENKFSRAEEIFGANGTASLFTREALEKTKISSGEYFDNKYFAFYEDVDLAWRIKLAGFKSFYCPEAIIYHVHSGTAGKSSLMKAYFLHRNYFFTVLKNYPCCLLVKTFFWRFLSYFQLVSNVFRKKKRETAFVANYSKSKLMIIILKAWGSVILNLPNIFKKRIYIQNNRIAKIREIREWVIKYKAE
jgi:GT2 family glycosyltransferase